MALTWRNVALYDPTNASAARSKLTDKLVGSLESIGDVIDPSKRQAAEKTKIGKERLAAGIEDIQSRETLEALREGQTDFSEANLLTDGFMTKEQKESLTGAAKAGLQTKRDLLSEEALVNAGKLADQSLDVSGAKLAMVQELEAAGMSPLEIERRVADFDKSGVRAADYATQIKDFTDEAFRNTSELGLNSNEDIQDMANKLEAENPQQFDRESFMTQATNRMEDVRADKTYIRTENTYKAHNEISSQLMAGVAPADIQASLQEQYGDTVDHAALNNFITATNESMSKMTPQERMAAEIFINDAQDLNERNALESSQLIDKTSGEISKINPISEGTQAALKTDAVNTTNARRRISDIVFDGVNSTGSRHYEQVVDKLWARTDLTETQKNGILQETFTNVNIDSSFWRGAGVDKRFGAAVENQVNNVLKHTALTEKLNIARDGLAKLNLAGSQNATSQALRYAKEARTAGKNVVDIPGYDGSELNPQINRLIAEIDNLQTEIFTFEKETRNAAAESKLRKEVKATPIDYSKIPDRPLGEDIRTAEKASRKIWNTGVDTATDVIKGQKDILGREIK